MAPLEGTVPIENDDHVLRARRTAATTRIVLGIVGIALILPQPHLAAHRLAAIAGFCTITATALVQRLAPRLSWLKVEESLAGTAAVLIVGLGEQRVTVLSVLWLAAVASGVMARGGRVHWIGRTVVLSALALPAIEQGRLTADHAALCAAAIGLLLTSGRLTRELNHLLSQARIDADSAETLLLAGDIASRVAGRDGSESSRGPRAAEEALSSAQTDEAREALDRLIAGNGLAMAVQPIVELPTGTVHAYEALARPESAGIDSSPLPWFALAEKLGMRDDLERACLCKALELYSSRPRGTRLSVNLSVPVLLDPRTLDLLLQAGESSADALRGLIIEITEETLVKGDLQLKTAFEPLRRQGARLAVDDMGAGYSGLRQIIAVRPTYLKLDRSLVCDIDHDEDRAALVGALVGYAAQVGSLLVAEGIESASELRRLQELGVPLAQGFYLGRPAVSWADGSKRIVRPAGIEPAACGLKDRCSLAPRREPLTTELRARAGVFYQTGSCQMSNLSMLER
jgi:EAL domain-containing protein (putative c-di-GMP-specific phosphodiesterase class I)